MSAARPRIERNPGFLLADIVPQADRLRAEYLEGVSFPRSRILLTELIVIKKHLPRLTGLPRNFS